MLIAMMTRCPSPSSNRSDASARLAHPEMMAQSCSPSCWLSEFERAMSSRPTTPPPRRSPRRLVNEVAEQPVSQALLRQ